MKPSIRDIDTRSLTDELKARLLAEAATKEIEAELDRRMKAIPSSCTDGAVELKALREANWDSRKRLAGELGVTPEYIAAAEAGKRPSATKRVLFLTKELLKKKGASCV